MKKIFILVLGISFIVATPLKKVFNVEGMMCEYGCVSKINTVVTSLKGVSKCEVNFESKTMEVLIDDNNITTKNIIELLPNPYIATLLRESVSKEYSVLGMTCMGCVNSINQSLENLQGIYSYNINLEDNMMVLEFDPNKINDKILFNIIPNQFKVVALLDEKDDKKSEHKSDKNLNN